MTMETMTGVHDAPLEIGGRTLRADAAAMVAIAALFTRWKEL